jgi:hypothetical protein
MGEFVQKGVGIALGILPVDSSRRSVRATAATATVTREVAGSWRGGLAERMSVIRPDSSPRIAWS